MKITEFAQSELNRILNENEAQGLEVVTQEGCCGGKHPVFSMVNFESCDAPETIDGIQVLMTDEVKALLEDAIIDFGDDGLMVFNKAQDGCCGGHHSDDEDHGCCGGHGHEGGCGCHQ